MSQRQTRQFNTLTAKEAHAILHRQAKKHLRISGKEFVKEWKAGKFKKDDRPEVIRVAMLLPFAE